MELEKIDDEADQAGVRLVKVDDSTLAKRYGVHALPALLFFKHGELLFRCKILAKKGCLTSGRFDFECVSQVKMPIRSFLQAI